LADALSPREVFHELVHGVADGRWGDLPRLYAAQTRVVHPFDPFRAPPLCSRDDLRKHFTPDASAGSMPKRRPTNISIHETHDPEVIVAEFQYEGRTVGTTAKPFAIPCIFVLRVRDGEIVSSRDYIDHVASARARGQLDEFLDALKFQSASE
jgi:ketosteroid isomerase-like protein